jgi:hypothetical protein
MMMGSVKEGPLCEMFLYRPMLNCQKGLEIEKAPDAICFKGHALPRIAIQEQRPVGHDFIRQMQRRIVQDDDIDSLGAQQAHDAGDVLKPEREISGCVNHRVEQDSDVDVAQPRCRAPRLRTEQVKRDDIVILLKLRPQALESRIVRDIHNRTIAESGRWVNAGRSGENREARMALGK